MKSYNVAIHVNFQVVLFIMLYKVALTFEYVDEILKCDHSNKSYWAVLFCRTVYYAVQGGSSFWVWMKSLGVNLQMKATEHWVLSFDTVIILYEVVLSLIIWMRSTEQYIPVVLFIMLYKVILTFESG